MATTTTTMMITETNARWIVPPHEGTHCMYCGCALGAGEQCLVIPLRTDGLGRYEYDHRRICMKFEELYAFVRYDEHNLALVTVTCRMLKELFHYEPRGLLPPRAHLYQYGGTFVMPSSTSNLDQDGAEPSTTAAKAAAEPLVAVEHRQICIPVKSALTTRAMFLQEDFHAPRYVLENRPDCTPGTLGLIGQRHGDNSTRSAEENDTCSKAIPIAPPETATTNRGSCADANKASHDDVHVVDAEVDEETKRLQSVLRCAGSEYFSHEDFLRDEIRVLNLEPPLEGQCIMEHFARLIADKIHDIPAFGVPLDEDKPRKKKGPGSAKAQATAAAAAVPVVPTSAPTIPATAVGICCTPAGTSGDAPSLTMAASHLSSLPENEPNAGSVVEVVGDGGEDIDDGRKEGAACRPDVSAAGGKNADPSAKKPRRRKETGTPGESGQPPPKRRRKVEAETTSAQVQERPNVGAAQENAPPAAAAAAAAAAATATATAKKRMSSVNAIRKEAELVDSMITGETNMSA